MSHIYILNDILITGETEQEQLKTIGEVLTGLYDAGFKLKLEKCAFIQPAVEYLDHHISAKGIRPSKKKLLP